MERTGRLGRESIDALRLLEERGAGVEAGLDGLRLTLPGPPLSRREDVGALLPLAAVSLLLLVLSRMLPGGEGLGTLAILMGGLWLGVMLAQVLVPSGGRSRSSAVLHLTDRALRCQEQSVPLEEIRAVEVEGSRARVLRVGQDAPALLIRSDRASLAALGALLEHHARRRRAVLSGSGHDLRDAAAPPAALEALRGVVRTS